MIESLQTYVSNFIIIANSLEPGETPSYSVSHQAPDDYLPLKLCFMKQFVVTITFLNTSGRIGTDRIGSEKNVNLISCSAVNPYNGKLKSSAISKD